MFVLGLDGSDTGMFYYFAYRERDELSPNIDQFLYNLYGNVHCGFMMKSLVAFVIKIC